MRQQWRISAQLRRPAPRPGVNQWGGTQRREPWLLAQRCKSFELLTFRFSWPCGFWGRRVRFALLVRPITGLFGPSPAITILHGLGQQHSKIASASPCARRPHRQPNHPQSQGHAQLQRIVPVGALEGGRVRFDLLRLGPSGCRFSRTPGYNIFRFSAPCDSEVGRYNNHLNTVCQSSASHPPAKPGALGRLAGRGTHLMAATPRLPASAVKNPLTASADSGLFPTRSNAASPLVGGAPSFFLSVGRDLGSHDPQFAPCPALPAASIRMQREDPRTFP